MGISPWRKRLNDLFQLISQADQTYFEPELFRLNINNAITTARTVTFLIQKNKARIPDYDCLYKSFVLDVCGRDHVMKWLIDARNTIEKEGDLAIHSQLRASVMFSYLEKGPTIDPPCEGLLFASQNTLWRAWLRMAPKSVVEDSAIVIDRRWVANTLSDYELTDALLHGFSVLRSSVDAFDAAIGEKAPVFEYDPLPNISSASRREYIKLSSGKVFSFRRERIPRTVERQAHLKKQVDDLFTDKSSAAYADASLPLRTRLQSFALMASKIFNRDGHHDTMYFQTDGNGRITASTGVFFADRIEKYIFWHAMADQAKLDPDFQGVFFIGEMWYRSAPIGRSVVAISDMPIIGEAIALTGATAKGEYEEIHVPITRNGDAATADFNGAVDHNEGFPNFLYPLWAAWGLKHPEKSGE
jgi:hypothetical protein